MNFEQLFSGGQYFGLLAIFIIVIIWSGVWKALALWRAAKNNSVPWFVILFIFNTLGILEIIYLLTSRNKKTEE